MRDQYEVNTKNNQIKEGNCAYHATSNMLYHVTYSHTMKHEENEKLPKHLAAILNINFCSQAILCTKFGHFL